jgi:hypothetical protein
MPAGVRVARGYAYSVDWAMPSVHARPWPSEPAQDQDMDRWSIPPGQLEASFARAAVLQREVERKERLLGQRIQMLAKGLADLMRPGEMHHRRGIGVHAFPVDGVLCLAASYLEEAWDEYRYRYAVLCGGEPAKRALNTADLDPGASDEPGSRRIALASYDDYAAFVDRLPKYLDDATRDLQVQLRQAGATEEIARQIGHKLSAQAKARRSRQAGDHPER